MPRKPPTVSVYERKSRGTFTVRWRERGQQREPVFHTRQEAEAAAEEIRRRLRAGLPGIRDTLPISQLIERWWNDYVSSGSLARSTEANYKTATRRVLETLGAADAQYLTTPNLIEWAKDLNATLRSPRLANECVKILSSAYQRGIEWGTVEPPNPVRAVPKFSEPPRSIVFPARADIIRVALTAPTLQCSVHLSVAGLCGLRPGEQIALEWRHINEDLGVIRVEQSMDLKQRLKGTKTGKPRPVPCPPSVLELLHKWRAESRFNNSRHPVFVSTHGQHLHASNWRRDVWYPWRDDAGVSIQWRTLRHYYASELAAMGATLSQCSRWMGHGSIRTTVDRYGFLFDEDADPVMQRFG